MVTTQRRKITCRLDIDYLLEEITSFADWHAERARLDLGADISQVFASEEEAADLRSVAETLDEMVIIPTTLFDEMFDIIQALEQLSEDGELPDVLKNQGGPTYYARLLDRTEEYTK